MIRVTAIGEHGAIQVDRAGVLCRHDVVGVDLWGVLRVVSADGCEASVVSVIHGHRPLRVGDRLDVVGRVVA